MKHFYFLLLFLTGFLFQTQLRAQGSQSNVIDEVIWVIGDDAIFLSDVERLRKNMQIEEQRIQGDPYCILPEMLALQKLYLHQAKLDSIEVTDSEISHYVERQISYYINYFGSEEKVEEYANKSLNALREDFRNTTKEQAAIERVQSKLYESVKVTPSDVQNFYKRIPEDSLPYIPTTVEVQIITLEPKPSLEEIDNVKSRLREYTDQVTSGQMQFSTLARMYSDDKETAITGGDLGLVGKSSFVPEFAAVAFDLNDPKRVSRIVETEYGYHIIQLIEKRGDRIRVRHILLRPRVTQEEISDALLSLDSLRNDIVNKTYTFDEIATWISNDKDTRNNKGLMVNTLNALHPNYTSRTGTSRFEMSELPPEIAKAVNEMQVGDISAPFMMISQKTSKEIVAIVKLKARIEGHKASYSDDFQALRAMVEEEKRKEILAKWIMKKQKETYIRINDNWKNCDFEYDGWLLK